MKVPFLVFGGTLILLGAAPVSAREFTDAKGRKIEAEIISVKGEEVTIRRDDGKDYTVAVNLFSPGDQAVIRSWKPATAPTMAPAAPSAGD